MKKTTISLLVLISIVNSSSTFARQYEFDYNVLNLHQDADRPNLDPNNMPGNYVVDVYLNDELKETTEFYFKLINSNLGPCLTQDKLLKYGINPLKISALPFDSEQCAIIEGSGISYIYNALNQSLILNSPSEYIISETNEIANENTWDDGINALKLNYRANYLYSKNKNNSYFWQIEPGLNFGPWRLRNLSSLHSSSKEKKFESAYTYAERGINKFKSRLTLGDKYTNTDSFDSIPYRGISIGKDESMIPFSKRTYSPKITGIAKSNANVEIRQNGYLIYSTSVPQGQFEISGEQLANVGDGILDVTVNESNGQVQNFTVPYSKPVISLPEGYSKYNATLGEYRDVNNYGKKPLFFEGVYSYGIPYGITLFGGAQWASIYNAYNIGVSKDFREYGALSLDWKNSKFRNKKNIETGNAYGINYNKNIFQTKTNVSLVNRYFYSKNYQTFSEAVEKLNNNNSVYGNKKSSTSLLLSQPLGSFGSINLSYNHDKYWKSDNKNSIIASYGNNVKGVSFLASYTKSKSKSKSTKNSKDENLFSLIINVPLQKFTKHEIYATYQSSSSTRDVNQDLGITGLAFDRQLSWQARTKIDEKSNNKSSYLNASWRGTYGEIGGSYSQNKNNNDIGVNFSGGILMHSSGVTFGQNISDTVALVEAKGVSGAKVLGIPGIKTDFRGYTISSALTPYMNNFVSIDPTSIPKNTDIRQTDINVVPTEGAVVKAVYKTSVGINALMKIKKKNGRFLSFGTILSLKDKNGVIQSTTIVGEDGEVYVSGLSNSQKLVATWGKKDTETCTVDYTLPKSNNEQFSFINGVCK